MKTFTPKPADIKRNWFIVDVKGLILGRSSTVVAGILMGKNKPCYARHMDCGDHVVVINADKIVLTGNKLKDKFYYRHSQYPGGLKKIAAGVLLKKAPDRVFLHSVRGMLPKNKLGDKLIKKLRVYAGEQHPHQSQKPTELKIQAQ